MTTKTPYDDEIANLETAVTVGFDDNLKRGDAWISLVVLRLRREGYLRHKAEVAPLLAAAKRALSSLSLDPYRKAAAEHGRAGNAETAMAQYLTGTESTAFRNALLKGDSLAALKVVVAILEAA